MENQRSADVDEFIGAMDRRAFFDSDGDIFITRAPGRLDIMGGIADYSGSLVLEMPTAEATFGAAQRNDSGKVEVTSLLADGEERSFEIELSRFESVAKARALFAPGGPNHWAAYAAGVFPVLMQERGTAFDGGVRILISSDVPLGKGVSSSAALETAVMQAVRAAFAIEIEPLEMALLCQI